MALAVAGLAAEGNTVVSTAEAVSVTFPTFVELMRAAGARIGTPP
jgi:3-phosphoshikimate 1-carboxyvinyltransferase